ADAGVGGAVLADGRGPEGAVGAFPAVPGGGAARGVVAAAGAGLGAVDGRLAAAAAGALAVAPAARRAGRRDDGQLRVRAGAVAAVHRLFDLLRRAVADHRAVGAVPRRAGRPAPLGRDLHRVARSAGGAARSEEHTSELQSRENLVCRLLLEKKKYK